MGKTLNEILGVPEGEAIDVIATITDKEARRVRIEYMGPDGVRSKSYTSDEARALAAEMMAWYAEQNTQGDQ